MLIVCFSGEVNQLKNRLEDKYHKIKKLHTGCEKYVRKNLTGISITIIIEVSSK